MTRANGQDTRRKKQYLVHDTAGWNSTTIKSRTWRFVIFFDLFYSTLITSTMLRHKTARRSLSLEMSYRHNISMYFSIKSILFENKLKNVAWVLIQIRCVFLSMAEITCKTTDCREHHIPHLLSSTNIVAGLYDPFREQNWKGKYNHPMFMLMRCYELLPLANLSFAPFAGTNFFWAWHSIICFWVKIPFVMRNMNSWSKSAEDFG